MEEIAIGEFLWGVATSAYQSEGGYNGAGEPQTNWAEAEHCGDVAPVGRGVEFWSRYAEDFRLARGLGLNAFRLGIEWSRVQPTITAGPGTPPPFDFAALDHYAEMLAACRSSDMEPVVTLHHFVHPAWLGEDPWLSPETAGLFVEFVRTSLLHLNSRLVERHQSKPIRFLITINEPNMLVLNTYLGNQFPSKARRGLGNVMLAYNQLFRAHVLAYNASHELYEERGWPTPAVSVNNYCSDLYWSDKLWLDLLNLPRKGVPRAEVGQYVVAQARAFALALKEASLPLHKDLPYYFGTFIKRISDQLGRRLFSPAKIQPLLEAIYGSKRKCLFDYIGLDYYDPFAAHLFRLPVWWDHEPSDRSLRSRLMKSITSKWWDWRILPRGLQFFCETYYEEYDRPVLIAESGMALRHRQGESKSPRRDGMTRSQFLRLHVHEVDRIRKRGIPLFGYLYWSLFDNYEWGTYTPRFGLFSIDYDQGTARIACDEHGDEPSRTYAELIADSRALNRPA
jgi:beta-glucosidase